jgi:holo-[acyl-carrier protein] synthase
LIVGIGVDIVDLARFELTLGRTPHLGERLFTDLERAAKGQSLAAVFAAKEAVSKALGAPTGLNWHDAEIRHDAAGRPYVLVTGTVAAAAAARGILRWHLSISHDAGAAVAMVVAEGDA